MVDMGVGGNTNLGVNPLTTGYQKTIWNYPPSSGSSLCLWLTVRMPLSRTASMTPSIRVSCKVTSNIPELLCSKWLID